MPGVVKVAISLPEALYEGRSKFFQRALGAFLRSLEEQEAVERYIRSYREQPENDEDASPRRGEQRRVGSGTLGVKRGELWWPDLDPPLGPGDLKVVNEQPKRCLLSGAAPAPCWGRSEGALSGFSDLVSRSLDQYTAW